MEIKNVTTFNGLKRDLESLNLKHVDEATPEKLFHYTDTSGLLGILNSQQLWATHAFYLNDATEIIYTYELVDEIYHDLKEQSKLDAEVLADTSDINDQKFIYQYFLAGIRYNTLRPKPNPNVYVSCFCEDDDLLSQWRGYGHMGSGYAIGIDTKQLIHPSYPFKLRKVIYSRNCQKQILWEILEVVIASLKEVTAGMGFDSANEHIEAHNLIFEEEAVKYAAFFKHPAFQEEKEWRLIYVPAGNHYSSQIKFRSGYLGIIPYAEIGLPNGENNEQDRILPITSIRIGPTAQPALARKALEMVADSKYPDLEITVSDVPLRCNNK